MAHDKQTENDVNHLHLFLCLLVVMARESTLGMDM